MWRSKQASYRIADPFFRFWFHYVYANRSMLGRGGMAHVARQVATTLDEFTSQAFETICREHVWHLAEDGELGFVPTAVGSWWTRTGTHEIDVVALGPDAVLLGECKWTSTPADLYVLEGLTAKGAVLSQQPELRGRVTNARYALFSRSGFTPRLQERARADGVLLVGVDELSS